VDQFEEMVRLEGMRSVLSPVVNCPNSLQLKYFIGRVRSNLHLILCFSPLADAFPCARRLPGSDQLHVHRPASTRGPKMPLFPWRAALLRTLSSAAMPLKLCVDPSRALCWMSITFHVSPQSVALHMAEVHMAVTAAS